MICYNMKTGYGFKKSMDFSDEETPGTNQTALRTKGA